MGIERRKGEIAREFNPTGRSGTNLCSGAPLSPLGMAPQHGNVRLRNNWDAAMVMRDFTRAAALHGT